MSNITVGLVSKPFSEVIAATDDLAGFLSVETKKESKAALAGPNDFLSILFSADIWEATIPWALEKLGIGALGFAGAQIANKLYKTKVEKKIEGLEQKLDALTEAIRSSAQLSSGRGYYPLRNKIHF
jgi:hypothetical protein